MAKKAAKTEKKAKAKKDSFLKDNYVLINEFDGVKTHAMHIRGIGTVVRETTEAGNVSSVFVPGVKVKTKKDWKYLILDKGPKSKKGGEETEDESED